MKLICINCPRGCHLEVENIDNVVKVTGNACPRGKDYATKEIINPERTITTTIKIYSNKYERLPVISNSQVAKARIMDVMRALKNVEVKAPIKMGDVVVANILGLGVDIIASKTINE